MLMRTTCLLCQRRNVVITGRLRSESDATEILTCHLGFGRLIAMVFEQAFIIPVNAAPLSRLKRRVPHATAMGRYGTD